jgi:hypothetical protein
VAFFLLAWPYLVSAAAALAWALLLRRRLDDPLGFALTAFIVCAIALETIDYACTYLLPLDIGGTPPPDPRNARMRFLVTAALQIPAALLLAGILAHPFRVRGRSLNSRSDG